MRLRQAGRSPPFACAKCHSIAGWRYDPQGYADLVAYVAPGMRQAAFKGHGIAGIEGVRFAGHRYFEAAPQNNPAFFIAFVRVRCFTAARPRPQPVIQDLEFFGPQGCQ